MITLNLLSPKQKGALHTRILYAMLERLMIFVVVIALLTTSVLLGFKIRLTQNLSTVQARQLLSSEYVSVNNEIRQFNQMIGQIERLQQQAIPVSRFIEDIVGRTPPGVLITSVDFDKKTGSVRINGRAQTRAKLLQFTEALRGLPFLKSLDSPISNLFQKTDVIFTLQGIVKIEELRKPIDPASAEASAGEPAPAPVTEPAPAAAEIPQP